MKIVILICGMLIAASSQAKLPAPSDEVKAKADETKAKAAWSDKVSSFLLCKAQDKVVMRYLKTKSVAVASAQMSPASAPVAFPPCADPGVYTSPLIVATNVPVPATMAPLKK